MAPRGRFLVGNVEIRTPSPTPWAWLSGLRTTSWPGCGRRIKCSAATSDCARSIFADADGTKAWVCWYWTCSLWVCVWTILLAADVCFGIARSLRAILARNRASVAKESDLLTQPAWPAQNRTAGRWHRTRPPTGSRQIVRQGGAYQHQLPS